MKHQKTNIGEPHPSQKLNLKHSAFRNLNKILKCKQFSMPHINKLLLKLEGFQYPTSIYLNMVYYYIRLIKDTSNLCTMILPWVKYSYKLLPMRITNSTDIFQHKMNDLFHGFEFIRAYMDNLLVLTKGYWINHVHKLK